MNVMKRQSWYLTEELVPLALASSRLDDEIKARVAHAIYSDAGALSIGKSMLLVLPNNAAEVEIMSLDTFSGPISASLFHSLAIGMPFFMKPLPCENPDYWRLSSFVTDVRVQDDAAK